MRCGVEPVVDTIVTSAAGSPRSSASVTAAKTSWFTDAIIRAGGAGGAGRAGWLFLLAALRRHRALDERGADRHRAGGGRQFACCSVDVGERDSLGDGKLDAFAAGERV